MSIKNKITNLELTLFIFSMLFVVNFNGHDLRILVSFFWLLKIVVTSDISLRVSKGYIKYLLFILLIIIYSFMILVMNSSDLFFIPLRYFRSLLNMIVIILFFLTKKNKIDSYSFFNAFIISLSVHALIIILDVQIPQLGDILRSFNGYNKKELPFRSTGLVSGYDFSGFYVNFGFFISTCMLIMTNKKKYLFYIILFLASVFLTSRTSTLIILITFIPLIMVSNKHNKKIKRKLVTFSFLLIFFVSSFFALSMQIASNFRTRLLSSFPFLESLYSNMTESYANYNVQGVIEEQIFLPSGLHALIGKGELAPTDPGYLDVIYSIGYIGLVLVIVFYFKLFIDYYLKYRFLNKSLSINNHIYLTAFYSFFYLVLLIFFMEFKLSFLFSSGAFETLIILGVFTKEEYTKFKEKSFLISL